ncbi:hypothetical protein RvY_09977-2 [Ramazzottius varieornatus]|uniref:G-protein coupled receptors family 1 profile domain-containing protein n=1 Tax=Ramazzottius varieornatus TaxID=947166 RepID=A0A1D1VDM1_RAMVA|nr:hypothetical protein RvY_09977-2 [Ramazzottius varieornatus]
MEALLRYPPVNMTTTPAPPEYMHPPFNYILGAIFAFLIIFSVSGNLLVLLIIARFRRMRTRTNLLLANMSAIDLLTGALAMPFSMVTAIHGGNWKLGDTACQINGFFVALFIASSIHTLMYLSIHKYVSIRNVFKHSITTKHIILMVIATWIWGLLFATGLVAGWTTIEHKHGATQVRYGMAGIRYGYFRVEMAKPDRFLERNDRKSSKFMIVR